MTTSGAPGSGWIGPKSTPVRRPELAGRRAVFLTFMSRPHGTLIIGFEERTPGTKEFARCEMCRRVQAPASWNCSDQVAVVSSAADLVELVDPPEGVSIQCTAVGFLSEEDALAFAGSDAYLQSIIREL